MRGDQRHLVFRVIGGAFCATMVGAIVTGRVNAVTGAHATLGTLRAGAALLSGMDQALASGFHFAFLGCAGMSILEFAIMLLAHGPMLRTTTAVTPQGE